MVSACKRQKLITLHKFEICTKLEKTKKRDKKMTIFYPILKKFNILEIIFRQSQILITEI